MSLFCPNLKKLLNPINKDESNVLRNVFNGRRYLKSVKIWCGGMKRNVKYRCNGFARNFHELKIV